MTPAMTRPPGVRLAGLPHLLLGLWTLGCGGPAALTVEMPLHLEDHLDVATISGSEAPAKPPQPVEWRFDQPQPDWKPATPWNPAVRAASLERTGEGVRVTLTDRSRNLNGFPVGGLYVDLPDWDRADWTDVVVRARADSASSVRNIGVGLNAREGQHSPTDAPYPFRFNGQNGPIVGDGTIQTYRLRVARGGPPWVGPWKRLGLWFGTDGEPGSIELLSVSVIPKGAGYADTSHGVRPVTIGERIRRTLFTHAPGRVSYRVRVPEQGRLDLALGVLSNDDSVSFRVTVQGRGEEETAFDERYADQEKWGQRSVDLAKFAGQTVTLTLDAQASTPGTVAFWGAPTLTGAKLTTKPNVIFYVIDGGGADQMSLYGYNRRTTPNLDRLAQEGAVFENAHSNATWSKPSTTGFMTSLQSSVLGNVSGIQFEPLPVEARTMAERFHAAGYQTAVFTSNAWAGSLSSLERGVDVFRDQGVRDTASSVVLHRDFWNWREGLPGEPYWVHFQTTDVHSPHHPTAPFLGLFAPGAEAQLAQWDSTLRQWRQRNAARFRTEPGLWRKSWAETGIDRKRYNDVTRSLYDETMAHQDYQLGRFVERLKETGQWDNTLLIIAADHSIWAGSDDFLTPMQDSLPPEWQEPVLRASVSRVPLLFTWPGHIAGGQRFSQPVSMIDVLPTVLDLAGLPQPEILQGQSLAPLLLGQPGWHVRPVIFDDFEKNLRTGELQGRIEMIDGRWGASLWIGAPEDTLNPRPTPLLLFDVWNDPLALKLMNDEHPDMVKTYTELLQKHWEAHRLLAQRFTPGAKVELSPEQLETLRALGYIR